MRLLNKEWKRLLLVIIVLVPPHTYLQWLIGKQMAPSHTEFAVRMGVSLTLCAIAALLGKWVRAAPK